MFKFFVEVAPLVTFFIGYKLGGILSATLYMLIASMISMALTYYVERTIHKANLISTILLLISGSLTLISGDSVFVKIKPTILYMLFGIVFLVSNYREKPLIQHMLQASIDLGDKEKWVELNTRFMYFFFAMAVANELVWRNFHENTWVNFKVFGALPITLIFVMMQIPFLLTHNKKKIDYSDYS